MEEAIQLQHYPLVEHIFSLKCVQNKCKNNDAEDYDEIMWRLIFWVFTSGGEKTLWYFDKIFKSLGITDEMLAKYLKYRYPKTRQEFTSTGWWQYRNYTLINKLLDDNKALVLNN